MMKMTANVASALGLSALVLALTMPTAQAKPPKFAQKSDQSIVEFAIGASGGAADLDDNGEDFDVLIAALLATGVVTAFDGTDYTVFAPNDQAFWDLTETDNDLDAVNAAISALGVEGIAGVLLYHVTEGVRNSRSVTRARQVEMLDGNTISYDGMIIANNSDAMILDADNRLADGMVHVIDTVLLP